jgi:hypothetical protein
MRQRRTDKPNAKPRSGVRWFKPCVNSSPTSVSAQPAVTARAPLAGATSWLMLRPSVSMRSPAVSARPMRGRVGVPSVRLCAGHVPV